MARPRVFVSSTYYDLKHIRASLEVFIESLGFDAVLFEKGDIPFAPDAPLDESCYREARNADIFVLIIGGRYGSSASATSTPKGNKKFFEQYESITRKEFEAAHDADVPTFILVDSAVASEYQTYLRNRDNQDVAYAHVDSAGVFKLLESIFERGRNYPVFHFDRATQIEAWLREQWAGLFQELLRSRSQQKQLTALNAQVLELQSVNSTLKNYLEAVLSKVSPDRSDQIIKEEESRLEKARKAAELGKNTFYKHLVESVGLSPDLARSLIEAPSTTDEAVNMIDEAQLEEDPTDLSGCVLHRNLNAQKDFNEARKILGKRELNFSKSSHGDVVEIAAREQKKGASVRKRKSTPTSRKTEDPAEPPEA
jgi:hypothetical protein